jgi:activating signal cointegrator complex subunit 3
VATATLAWGINVPAHLVIVKGTEYYDGKTHKYIDFPVTGELFFTLKDIRRYFTHT